MNTVYQKEALACKWEENKVHWLMMISYQFGSLSVEQIVRPYK